MSYEEDTQEKINLERFKRILATYSDPCRTFSDRKRFYSEGGLIPKVVPVDWSENERDKLREVYPYRFYTTGFSGIVHILSRRKVTYTDDMMFNYCRIGPAENVNDAQLIASGNPADGDWYVLKGCRVRMERVVPTITTYDLWVSEWTSHVLDGTVKAEKAEKTNWFNWQRLMAKVWEREDAIARSFRFVVCGCCGKLIGPEDPCCVGGKRGLARINGKMVKVTRI